MIWNRYDIDVSGLVIRANEYGVNHIEKKLAACNSYKEQARLLLAKVEILNGEIAKLKASKAAGIDILDGVSVDDMTRFNGLSIEKNEKLSCILFGVN